MKIFLGQLEVLETGTLVIDGTEIIDFLIQEKPNYFVRIKFVQNINAPFPNVTVQGIGQDGIMLEFLNFKNPTGSGSTEPIKIGNVKGRTLFLSYKVYSIQTQSPPFKILQTLHYTWMLGDY